MFNFSPTQYDLNFSFLNFRIRINPFFWVLALLLFVQMMKVSSLREWLLLLAAWVCAIFISVLVHELGHACVFRYIFFVESDIMLHGFGGVTTPHFPPRRYYGVKGLLYKIFLDAAGCLSGFILAAIAFGLFITIPPQNAFNLQTVVEFFLKSTMYISVVWGIFNLLPIYPLDGGQISREIFLFFSPKKGLANSLAISLVTAGICIWICIIYQMIFVAILVGFMAYQNYLELNR
ncbi:MAG: site-2 protease family protein [Planctomycetaceae bacterium]|jgi:Zn-dependent protease|nr:site-2 protease family protein [Planctomycetaceae bacterium]